MNTCNPLQKNLIDHLNKLNEFGKTTTSKLTDDLALAMKNLNIWVSRDDL
jgi:hypothetical protein